MQQQILKHLADTSRSLSVSCRNLSTLSRN